MVATRKSGSSEELHLWRPDVAGFSIYKALTYVDVECRLLNAKRRKEGIEVAKKIGIKGPDGRPAK